MSNGLFYPLKRGGGNTTLFIVPAAGSTPLSVIRLARLLKKWPSAYAFSAPGLERPGREFASIAQLATACLSEIKSIQPQGPFALAGHCWGGVLAHELARQFEQAGDEVSELMILESLPPLTQFRTGETHTADTDAQSKAGAEREQALQTMIDRTRDQVLSLPPRVIKQFARVTEQLFEIGSHHQAEPITAPILLFRTATYPDTVFEDWRHLGGGLITAGSLPGDTWSVLQPPLVEELAKQMDGTTAALKQQFAVTEDG